MKIIDEKGRIFGKVNMIDLLVILIILSAIPITYSAFKLLNKQVKTPFAGTYEISRNCPNCGYLNYILIKKGEPVPDFYEKICTLCENKVVLIKPDSEPKKER